MRRLDKSDIKLLNQNDVIFTAYGRRTMALFLAVMTVFCFAMAMILSAGGTLFAKLSSNIARCVFAIAFLAATLILLFKALRELRLHIAPKMIFCDNHILAFAGDYYIELNSDEISGYDAMHKSSIIDEVGTEINKGKVILELTVGETLALECSDIRRVEVLTKAFILGKDMRTANTDYVESTTSQVMQRVPTILALVIPWIVLGIMASFFYPTLGNILLGAFPIFAFFGTLALIVGLSMSVAKNQNKQMLVATAKAREAQIASKEGSIPPRVRDLTNADHLSLEQYQRQLLDSARSSLKGVIILLVFGIALVGGAIAIFLSQGTDSIGFLIFMLALGALFIYGFIDQLNALIYIRSAVTRGTLDTAEFVTSKTRNGKSRIVIRAVNDRNEAFVAKTPFVYSDGDTLTAAADKTVLVMRTSKRAIVVFLPKPIAESVREF